MSHNTGIPDTYALRGILNKSAQHNYATYGVQLKSYCEVLNFSKVTYRIRKRIGAFPA